MKPSPGLRQRGISLIEALVAMAIMAFGMLGLLGLQATLRSNADISKQRSEAVRIAQETVETHRGFSVLETTGGARAYADIASSPASAVQAGNTNATFMLTRTVTDFPGVGQADSIAAHKSLVVDVTWQDRTDVAQAVRLSTMVARVAPELQVALSSPAEGSPMQNPQHRHRGIPPGAKPLPGGISVFMPPQPSTGTVAWVFNNTTGLLKSCIVGAGSTTASLTLEDLGTGCLEGAFNAQLLSGYVRFAADGTPSEAEAEAPSGTALNLDMVLTLTSSGHPTPGATCFDDAPESQTMADAQGAVVYYCAININTAGTWAGRSRILPLGFLFPATGAWVVADSGGTNRKVCRYTPLNTHTPPRNADHPRDYTAAGSAALAALTNQNFLVISAQHSCPTDTVASDDLINSNTLVHQDGSITYDNPRCGVSGPACPAP